MSLNSIRAKPAFTPDAQANVGNRRKRLFAIVAVALTGVFALPLARVIGFALGSEIHSYILLVPFISAYLFRISYQKAGLEVARGSVMGGAIAAIIGVGFSGMFVSTRALGCQGPDALRLATIAYLVLLLAAALFLFGWSALRAHLFPIFFLVFFVPLPAGAINWLSTLLQRASADVADWFLRGIGMPVFRDGLSFKLPAITIVVAEECSGIRSTLVLFLTSLLIGHLFLRNPWHKAILVLLVIPLGILRNAFRITTIAWLTVNVDPRFVDSPLHHRGGPIFFVLSLVPLFLLLCWFWRRERC